MSNKKTFYSPERVAVNLQASFWDHTEALCKLVEQLNSLNMMVLFPGVHCQELSCKFLTHLRICCVWKLSYHNSCMFIY